MTVIKGAEVVQSTLADQQERLVQSFVEVQKVMMDEGSGQDDSGGQGS